MRNSEFVPPASPEEPVIFISPEAIGKVNAAAACIACFLATYVLEVLSEA
jgi:hypothetical protein